MTVLEFGAGDFTNYVIGWKKREDGKARALVIGQLEKPLPFGTITNSERTPIKIVQGIPLPLKPKTNADRIRRMSDEELAENIIVMAKDNYCGGPDQCKNRSCYQCRLEWLRKEEEQ